MDKAIKCPVWSRVEDKKEGKMYGILLESVQFFVIKDVGEDVWQQVLQHAGMKNMVFSTHETYSDDLMLKLATSCSHVTKRQDFNHWMTFFGTCFVEFCSIYGYDNLLQVSGRTYRDFLHGIDNIHEIIRFSYPRLQSPSFLVLFEDIEGCVLLYQSKRKGFKHYVKGQLSQIAKKFYQVTLSITILEEDVSDNICSVKFRLDFDNSVFSSISTPAKLSGTPSFSSISGDIFLKVFPFCIVFDNQLIIKNVGHSMAAFLKGDNVVGCHLREKFHIRRPLIPCIWKRILRFQRVIFELEYLQDNNDLSDLEDSANPAFNRSRDQSQSDNQKCLLRGEMKYIEDWNMVAFLCTPLLNNLKDLQAAGLCIHDLNMFDMSRDMVMAGWQHASQLERSIEQQRDKSELIGENMRKIEEWKNRSDSLLYSMIPQSIAERLKSGMNPIDTCQLFDMVTIMFVYMVGFADICTSASPMEIVKCINNLFVVFDQVVDQYDVFKVETLGDAVYMVAGGVPDRDPKHAINVAMVALKLQEKAETVIYQIGKNGLNTRIGMHSGSVVGGVVGRRMPQYCLFGDTVNTASRMQTYSLPGRIHVSEPCNDCLKGSNFVTVNRGKVNIKGKGEMQTYWLLGEEGDNFSQAAVNEIDETVSKISSCDNALDLYGMHASTSYSQIELQLASRRASTPQTPPFQTSQSDIELQPGYKPSSNTSPLKTSHSQVKQQDGFPHTSNPHTSKSKPGKQLPTSPHKLLAGYKHSSHLQHIAPLSSQRSITKLPKYKQPSMNRRDSVESAGMKSRNVSRQTEDAISFFLHQTDTSEEQSDSDEDVEQNGAVGGIFFTANTGEFLDSSKPCKKQESLEKEESTSEEESGTTDEGNVLSMFCPFLSSNVNPATDGPVPDVFEKANQGEPRVDEKADTVNGVYPASPETYQLYDNTNIKIDESEPKLEYSASAAESKYSHCPFISKSNHSDSCEQYQHLNNNDKYEESNGTDMTGKQQNHCKQVCTTKSKEDRIVRSHSLADGPVISKQVVGQTSVNGLHEMSSSELDVEISFCETEVSQDQSVDDKLMEKIRKICCMSQCSEGQCAKKESVKTIASRKLSTGMTDEGDTPHHDICPIKALETKENLVLPIDYTNHTRCNTVTNEPCFKTECKHPVSGFNGLRVDSETNPVLSNGHGHLLKDTEV